MKIPRDVYVLSGIAFLVAIGFGVMLPVLPVLARSFGVSNLAVGAVISSFALMRLASSPLCSKFATRYSERVVLGLGMFIVSVSTALAASAQTFTLFLIWRAIGGIGSAMFTVSAMMLLLRSVPTQLRGRASGIYSGGFLLGGMTGPAVGGALAAISLTAPFYFYSVSLAIAGVVALTLLRAPKQSLIEHEASETTLRQALSDVRYRAACWTGFAQGWQSYGVRSALIPVLVVEGLNSSPSWTGIAFAIAAVTQTIMLSPAGRWSDLKGRRPVMIAAGLTTGLSAIAMPWAPTITVLIVVLAIYGAGSAFHATAPAATVGDVVQGRGGTPIAAYGMVTDFGSIIGPLAAGLLADSVGMPLAFAVGGAMLLGGSAYSWFMPKQQHSKDAPEA